MDDTGGAASTAGGSRADAPNTKVSRVIEEYGLDGFGDELERRWTGENGDRSSLRELADVLNRRLLEVAAERADHRALEGELDNTYRLLTSDDVSRGVRTETEKQLLREGIDVEALRQDFVSHQAVHTYLRRHRGASPERNDGNRAEKATETIRRLRSRTQAVTETTIDGLANADHVEIGSANVLVTTTVACEECGAAYDAVELIERGHCDCVPADRS